MEKTKEKQALQMAEPVNTEAMEAELDALHEAEKEQAAAKIDHATEQGVLELQQTEEEAREQFAVQRDQIDIDEARALDNQALYAEARGDDGGIGREQYGSIQNQAAASRYAVSKAQTKLSTDTAREIAALRAQGEFEKADALLSLTQNYLSQLVSLRQWAQEYNLSVSETNAALQQWEQEYLLEQEQLGIRREELVMKQENEAYDRQQQAKEQLSKAGWELLESGILPSEAQLEAMGISRQQAEAYLEQKTTKKTKVVYQEKKPDKSTLEHAPEYIKTPVTTTKQPISTIPNASNRPISTLN